MYSETTESKNYDLNDMERLRVAYSLFKEGMADKALEALQTIETDSYKDCEDYHRQMLACLTYLERHGEAEKLATALIGRFGHIFEAPWLALISAYHGMGKEEEAAAVLEETLGFWPNDPRLLMLTIGSVSKDGD